MEIVRFCLEESTFIVNLVVERLCRVSVTALCRFVETDNTFELMTLLIEIRIYKKRKKKNMHVRETHHGTMRHLLLFTLEII